MFPYVDGLYGPYAGAYQGRQNLQPAVSMQVVKVNGEPGARAYQMPANSSALLLDEQQPVVWLAQTDGAGYKTVTPYRIEPFLEPEKPDFGSIVKRIERLEELIHESNTAGNNAE